MIPLALMMLVLIPFLIQTLNGTPADASWVTLLGAQLSSLVTTWLANTQFALGIPLSFQKQGLSQTILLIAFSYAFLSFLSDYLLRDYGECIANKLRTDIFIKFLSLEFLSAIRLDAGILSAMVGTDVRETQQTFARLVSSLLRDGITSIVFVTWLVLLDYQLFILFLTILIPAALILTKTGRVLKRLSKQGIQLESDLLNGILERMRGWQTIQIYKAIPFEIKNFNQINHKIFNTWRRATRAKALGSPLVEWFGIIAASLVAVIALRRVFNAELSTPVLVSFVVTIGLLADKITRMADQINSSKKGIESLKRILNFFKIDLKHREIINFDVTHKKNKMLTSIEIENLSISLSGQTILVENLSGIFQEGSFVILIGPSGTGKTTLLNVLLGLQNYSVGNILLNKKVASESDYLSFASQIGFIPQEPQIFQGSLLDNVFYPNLIKNPTTEQIEQAQNAMNLSNLNLDLNANVFGLSGGEKQRLMFARIFFNMPRLVVIDEGTSALDIQNETKILQTLKEKLSHSIIFMVSHRFNVKQFGTHIIDLSKYKV